MRISINPIRNVESCGVPVMPCGPFTITVPSGSMFRAITSFRGKMEAIGIFPDIQNIDQVLDDLAKCQRNDGKVVTLSAQYRDTDQDTEYCCHRNTDQQRQQEPDDIHCDHIPHAF